MPTTSGVRRVTVTDIARAAGVSPAAVSFALNGRPGLADSTRSRILEVADALAWLPPTASRRKPGEKTFSIGFALERNAGGLAVESFYSQFVAGVETELARRSYALTWQIVPSLEAELEIYHRWHRQGSVDGVILVDVRVDDPRVRFFARPGAIPAIVVGDVSVAHGLTSISVDDAGSMRSLVSELAALGHRSITRISGREGNAYTGFRDDAFLETAMSLGIVGVIERTDLSARAAAIATWTVLTASRRPTALVYESDVMALAGIGVARELGIGVPEDVSIVALDDSPICAVSSPALTAMSRNVLDLGRTAAGQLLRTVDGGAPEQTEAARPVLLARGTTGAPPRS
jgi:DNA-binding LacI/PurR family transcriptional regulator